MSITGPFTKTPYDTARLYQYQEWYRQPAPYVAPLTYDMVYRERVYSANGTTDGDCRNMGFILTDVDPCYVHAYNKAYGKLIEALSTSAANAVNLAERKQAVTSISNRAVQVFRFAKAVRSLNFLEAGRTLGLTVVFSRGTVVRFKTPHIGSKEARRLMRNPSLVKARKMILHRDGRVSWESHFKRNVKDFGNNYLEYHFGWEPLLKDIHANIKILTDPFMSQTGRHVFAKGNESLLKAMPKPIGLYNVASYFEVIRSGVELGANFVITNPNEVKAGQLGLVNPLVLAWELIPFSFLVDWFVNVGQVLASYTDFVGYTIKDGYESRLVSATETQYWRDDGNKYPIIYTRRHLSVKRRPVSNFGPRLVWKPPRLPSVTRALTAVSLLTAFLSSH